MDAEKSIDNYPRKVQWALVEVSERRLLRQNLSLHWVGTRDFAAAVAIPLSGVKAR
jgi:hypothetical protein